MASKMRINITVFGEIDRISLRDKVAQYGARVMNLGKRTCVYMIVDPKENAFERVLAICSEYSDNIGIEGESVDYIPSS